MARYPSQQVANEGGEIYAPRKVYKVCGADPLFMALQRLKFFTSFTMKPKVKEQTTRGLTEFELMLINFDISY